MGKTTDNSEVYDIGFTKDIADAYMSLTESDIFKGIAPETETKSAEPETPIDTVGDNSNEGTNDIELSDGMLVNVEKGAFLVLRKGDNSTYTIDSAETMETDDGYIIGRVSEEGTLQGAGESFDNVKSATFEGTDWTITPNEDSTYTIGWTKGIVHLDERNPVEVAEKTEEIPQQEAESEVTTKDALPESTEPTVEKTATTEVPTTKAISVADQLYDEPVQWEMYDIFNAFMSACYQLSVAAEVTENPMTAQYMALVDELSGMLKKCILQENAEDTVDGDGTADDFVGDDDDDAMKSFRQNLVTKIAHSILGKSSNHNKLTSNGDTIQGIHDGLKSINADVCGVVEDHSAELQAKIVELESEIATKATKLEELEPKVTHLEAEVEQKNQAIETLQSETEQLKNRLLPPEKRAAVEVNALGTGTKTAQFRSVVEMTNNELSDEDTYKNLYGV